MPRPLLGRSNNDDRRQWRKQGVAVGAAASKTQAKRCGCWVPQPGQWHGASRDGEVIPLIITQRPVASLPGAFFEKGRSFLPCLFNSFDPYFKQPFGAVRAGQSVHLSLCIPEELGYVDPHLVLQKEQVRCPRPLPDEVRRPDAPSEPLLGGRHPQRRGPLLLLFRPLHRLPPHRARAGQLRRRELAGGRKLADHGLRGRF